MKNFFSAIETGLLRLEAILAWLPMLLVLIQFAVILMVTVFSIGSIKLQESLQYINALMFLGAAGTAAVRDKHVRVDPIYSRLSKRGKAWVDLLGTCLLLMPFLALLWWASLPYAAASWRILEGSVEASGLPLVYVLKSSLLLFCASLSLFAVTHIARQIRTLRQPPPRHADEGSR